jgi:hypothetical protein
MSIESSIQRTDVANANQTLLIAATVFSFGYLGQWIYTREVTDSEEPIWIGSMGSFTNFMMKVSYMDGSYDYLYLTCKVIYVLTLIYYFSMLKILNYLDEKKCKVLTYTEQFRQVIGALLLTPFLLGWWYRDYSIIIFLTCWFIALMMMILSLKPESYNMLLQLNQLLAMIPIVIAIFWFCTEYFHVTGSSVAWIILICEALIIAYLVNIIYVPMFTKEIGYYCMELKMPDRTQSIYQRWIQDIKGLLK